MSMQLQAQAKTNSTQESSFTPIQLGLQRKCASNVYAEHREKNEDLFNIAKVKELAKVSDVHRL